MIKGYFDPIFNAVANSINKNGSKKNIYFPYIIKAQVGGRNLIEVKLKSLPNNNNTNKTSSASNDYLSYTVTKKLDLLTSFSFVPAKKECFLFSGNSSVNVSEIIFNHFENLKLDLIGDNSSIYTQTYQLILPILKYFNGKINYYGVPICLGSINEVDLNREWSQFKDHSDHILNHVGNIANCNLISNYVKKRDPSFFLEKASLFPVGSFSKICLASDCNFPPMPGDDFCYSCAAHESD